MQSLTGSKRSHAAAGDGKPARRPRKRVCKTRRVLSAEEEAELLRPDPRFHVSVASREDLGRSETTSAVADKLFKWGVVVITGVMDEEEAARLDDRIVGAVEALTGAHPDTAKVADTLVTSRKGRIQTVLPNIAAINEQRACPHLAALWRNVLRELRKRQAEKEKKEGKPRPPAPSAEDVQAAKKKGKLAKKRGRGPSPPQVDISDGERMTPAGTCVCLLPRGYTAPRNGKLWTHKDNGEYGFPWKMIQGELVLRKSPGAHLMVCPRSHAVTERVMEVAGEPVRTHPLKQFVQIEVDRMDAVREVVEAAGGEMNVPVVAPPGSLIMWAHDTLHMASLPTRDTPVVSDPRGNGRHVLFVSFRPHAEIHPDDVEQVIARALEHNFGTNHSCTMTFEGAPGGHSTEELKKRSQRVCSLHASPEAAFAVVDPVPPGPVPGLEGKTRAERARQLVRLRGVDSERLTTRILRAWGAL